MKSLRKIPLCKIVIAFALAISMLPSGTLRAQEAAEDPNWGHKQVAVDPKIYDGYAGRYQLTPDLVVRVFRDGDHLYAQATGQAVSYTHLDVYKRQRSYGVRDLAPLSQRRRAAVPQAPVRQGTALAVPQRMGTRRGFNP